MGLTGREKDRQTKSPSMSFDRDVGDIGLKMRRGGHSCVPKPDWLGDGEVVSVCVWYIGGGVRMGGCWDWTQRINYYKSPPRPHVYGCYANCCLTIRFPSRTLQCMHCVCVSDERGPGLSRSMALLFYDNGPYFILTANISP